MTSQSARPGLGAAAKTAKARQAYPKPAPTPTPAPAPAKQKRKRKPAAATSRPTATPAREEADRIAAEVYGLDHDSRPEKHDRRKRWVQLNVEVTPEQAAKVAALARIHGSRKAAIGHLLDEAKVR